MQQLNLFSGCQVSTEKLTTKIIQQWSDYHLLTRVIISRTNPFYHANLLNHWEGLCHHIHLPWSIIMMSNMWIMGNCYCDDDMFKVNRDLYSAYDNDEKLFGPQTFVFLSNIWSFKSLLIIYTLCLSDQTQIGQANAKLAENVWRLVIYSALYNYTDSCYEYSPPVNGDTQPSSITKRGFCLC